MNEDDEISGSALIKLVALETRCFLKHKASSVDCGRREVSLSLMSTYYFALGTSTALLINEHEA